MIPIAVPDLRGREAQYLAQCVADNWVSSAGPFVSELEKQVAALAGRAHGIACVNGTTALQLSLHAIGLRPGEIVILPDWTFAATANAIVHAGGVPLFVDILESDWSIDPTAVAAAIANSKDNVRAIIAVDVLGNLPDPAPLRAVAQRHGVVLIEDAACALGARKDGVRGGGYGDLAAISFNGNKTVTAGGGGMVVTDNADWAREIRHLSTQARTGADYRHDRVGFNFRMTNVNAAIGLAQVERIDEMLAAKRRIAAAYKAALQGRNDLAFMPVEDFTQSGCWLSVVRTASSEANADLAAHLRQAGIDARSFWCALSDQPPYRGYASPANPLAHGLNDRTICLPSSSHLGDADLNTVLAALAAWQGPSI
ncbi:aminotransferase class I/II-fold pyridoxal phosphate-dependent enzyme [Ferrovibrio sp.]|uniref:DegT/DnrJ/EryC1/StrS family aminotransferase n=1 Tax=Ferrovibrio sp. TaxID=1917215 RepID=UPI0025C19415|nr:aminotransferase class I/II-fold pyridoxal phosphate-dependent enzyme [Ferrovibrio sp.]MBX3456303.1 aminotransferase class I/II-fold pyridoxal phosphate-dependent enzyme [Ferrovibrio sp.]